MELGHITDEMIKDAKDNPTVFYVTFGQTHPYRDYYKRVKAPNYEAAREAVISAYGMNWSMLYAWDDFAEVALHFPGGEWLPAIKV